MAQQHTVQNNNAFTIYIMELAAYEQQLNRLDIMSPLRWQFATFNSRFNLANEMVHMNVINVRPLMKIIQTNSGDFPLILHMNQPVNVLRCRKPVIPFTDYIAEIICLMGYATCLERNCPFGANVTGIPVRLGDDFEELAGRIGCKVDEQLLL
jgi:hypothetical protein